MGLKCVCGAPGMSCEYVQSAYPDGCPCEDVCMEWQAEAPEDADKIVGDKVAYYDQAVVRYPGSRFNVSPLLLVSDEVMDRETMRDLPEENFSDDDITVDTSPGAVQDVLDPMTDDIVDQVSDEAETDG